jgi:hypothetical protein
VNEYTKHVIAQQKELTVQASLQSTSTDPVEQPCGVDCQIQQSDQPPKKRKRGGVEKVGQAVKDQIKAAKTILEQVTLVQNVYNHWNGRLNDLVGPDQTFVYRNIKKTGVCITSCHGGDIGHFVENASGFKPSKYMCGVCDKTKN